MTDGKIAINDARQVECTYFSSAEVSQPCKPIVHAGLTNCQPGFGYPWKICHETSIISLLTQKFKQICHDASNLSADTKIHMLAHTWKDLALTAPTSDSWLIIGLVWLVAMNQLAVARRTVDGFLGRMTMRWLHGNSGIIDRKLTPSVGRISNVFSRYWASRKII